MTLRTAPDQPPAQPAAPSALALSPLLPANPPVAVLAMPPAPTTPVPDDLSPAPLPEPSERSTDVPTATASPPSAVVTGVVTGADGLPRAEVRVVARAWDGGVAEVARTGVDGSYRLSLGAGRWALSTEAPAYAAAWYPNRTEPLSAVAIEGAAGSVTSADFVLTAAPDGRIEGVVLDEAGEPVPGALVVAAPTAAGVASVGGLAAAVIADAAGAYRLPLAPGAWFVAAAADWRGGRLAWWQGVGSGAAAEAVLVPDDSSSVNLALRISTVDP